MNRFSQVLKYINTAKIIAVFPFLLFVINFIAKVIFLTAYDIGLDEPFTLYHAQFSPGLIVDLLKNYNNPPLYELVLHYWIGIFGISPFAVRFLPLIFACLCPVALYFFAKKNFSIQIAVASSLLLSFSDLLMYYSHDSRVYTLFLLLSIFSMHAYMDVINENKKYSLRAVIFVITSSLLIYAHYFGAFILFFQSIHLLLFKREKIKYFAIYYTAILLLYLPHIYPLLVRLDDSVSNGTWLAPPDGLESLYNMLWTFSNFPFITVTCIVLLVLALAKFIRSRKVAESLSALSLILIWFIVPYLGMYVISFQIPMYIGRYLIFVLPAYYITLIICIEYLIKETQHRNLFIAVLIACFAFTHEYNPTKHQPVSKCVAEIKKYKTPTTMVIVTPAHIMTMFAYHYNREYFTAISDNREYFMTDSLLKSENIFHIQEKEQYAAIPRSHYDRVLLFTQGEEINTPENPLYDTLMNDYELEWKNLVEHNWYVRSFKLKQTSTF